MGPWRYVLWVYKWKSFPQIVGFSFLSCHAGTGNGVSALPRCQVRQQGLMGTIRVCCSCRISTIADPWSTMFRTSRS